MYQYPEIDWSALRKYRTHRVKDVMRQEDIDTLLLTGHDNIRYATDFGVFLICEAFDWFAAIVTKEGEATIFIPYVDQPIRDPLPTHSWIKEFVPLPSWVSSLTQLDLWVKALSSKLKETRARKLGIDTMPFQMHHALQETLPTIQMKSVYMSLAQARQVKHPEEIKLICSSAKIASIGGTAGQQAVQEGALDFEVLGAIDGKMRSMGAEYITHNVCVQGESQVTAGWFPRGNRLWQRSVMAFDWGCYVKGGYGSDMCRTGFVGIPSKKVQKAYQILLEAHHASQAVARPGVKVSVLDRTVNDYLRKNGYPTVPYSLGHGVGLRACELPIIYRPEMMSTDAALEEGMVICLEPETVVQDNDQTVVVKVEDMFAVTRTGLEQLTTTGYTPFWKE